MSRERKRLIKTAIAALTVFNLLTWYVVFCVDRAPRAVVKEVIPAIKTVASLENIAVSPATVVGTVTSSRPLGEAVSAPIVPIPSTNTDKTVVVTPIRKASTRPPKEALASEVGIPALIRIPRLALVAAVEKVALTADGSMAVPKRLFNAGWYDLGPRPGESGSAVIDGHVNGPQGAVGVFAGLHELEVGDRLIVEDERGASVTFTVGKIMRYNHDTDATPVFSSDDGLAHLNLITCDGEWDRQSGQYAQRLVVFANRETKPKATKLP